MSGLVDGIIKKALAEGRKSLLEPEAKSICMEYGIPTPPFQVARDEDSALEIARRLGYPVVLKVVSPDILHKTEAGGVLIDIRDDRSLRSGFRNILKNAKAFNPAASIAGVLVQKMAPKGTEVIVGAINDSQFGQTLLFGLGGIFVEIMKDVTFRIAPITETDAREMVHEIKAYPVLKGYRNIPPADEEALVRILLASSKLVMEHEEIDQMDLNPIMVYEKGASVVDARIILRT